MKIAEVQFSPWEKIYNFDSSEIEVSVGDYVIVKTKIGIELGRVAGVFEMDKKNTKEIEEDEIKPILRKATADDLKKRLDRNQEKNKAMDICREFIKKHNLEMKLVDVHFSFDGGRITFAFIAEGRVDFRNLVKDLTHHFQKSIRLHQLGIRDEAKLLGDIGMCGRNLCCKKMLKEITSVTSEAAELQQITHRGSDRLSGSCGRLMCCLNYEKDEYLKLVKNLPQIGTKVKIKGEVCNVIGWHTLKQTVDVKMGDAIMEVPVSELR